MKTFMIPEAPLWRRILVLCKLKGHMNNIIALVPRFFKKSGHRNQYYGLYAQVVYIMRR